MTGEGYILPQQIEGGARYVAILPLIYTSAIIVGKGDDYLTGYDDRWCYHSTGDAIVALAEWAERDYVGEPNGWHRHPDSGRRRPDGDPAKEYVNV